MDTSIKVLSSFSQALSIAADTGTLYKATHQAIQQILGEQAGVLIAEYDPVKHRVLIPYAHDGRKTQTIAPFGLQEDVISDMLRSGHSVGPGKPERSHEFFANRTVQSLIGAPLLATNQPMGAILVQDFERSGRFTMDDLELLRLVANQLAAQLHSLVTIERTQQQSQKERDLYEIGKKIRGSTDMQTILQITAEELLRVFAARRVQAEVIIPDPAQPSLTPPPQIDEANA
jgi:GAF domain-containing protein